jgi:multidrug efflux pump subunit AcrB
MASDAAFNYSYRHPHLTVLALCLSLVVGLSALINIPRQEDPEITERFGGVKTVLPGASAARVEALVTEKIENLLQEIEEIKTVKSRSQTGVSAVTIELDDHVMVVDDAWSRIRDKLVEAQSELPADAGAPDLDRTTTAAFTLLIGLTWSFDDDIQLDLLNRLAKELRQRLLSLAGTKEVELYGEPQEEILVTIDAMTMASANVTAIDVSRAIRESDSKVSAGRLQSDLSNLIIEVGGQLDSVDRIRNIPLRRGDGGNFLHVGDIATVEKVPAEPPATMTLVHGNRGITVAAKMEPNRRVDLWTAEAREVFELFSKDLPKGVRAEVLFEQGIHTEERLANLTQNLLLGAAIVVVVLFVMMGWRSALLVTATLPLTLALVLGALNFLDVPMHQISLAGLIIALGLLIDNAIISVDEYHHNRRRGLPPPDAIAVGVRRLFAPLLAATATTTLTFLPLVLMPGNAGEFVRAVGVSVILSIGFSLLLSLTVLPALAGYFDRPGLEAKGGFSRHGLSSGRLLLPYNALLAVVLRWPPVGILIALAIPVAGFGLSGQLVEQFFPPVNRNQFQVLMKLPPQSSLAETLANVRRAEQIIRAHPEVLTSHWFIGETPPRVFYNTTVSEDDSPSLAGGFVDTTSAADTHALLPGLQIEMMESFPNATVLSLPFEQGPPVEAPVEVRIYGPDLDTLLALGEELRLILSETDQITYSEATVIGGRPKLDLRPDEEEATLAGFNLVDLATQLNANLDGVLGGTVLEGTEELPVRVRVGRADRTDLARITETTLRAPGRALDMAEDSVPGVPLSVLARVEVVPEINTITRRNGERLNIVQAFVVPFALPGLSLADFRKRLAESAFTLPPGYRLEYGGETEGSGEARRALIGVMAPLLVLMIGTVVLAFRSFRMAGIVGLVALLSVGSALLTLWVFNYPMGFMAVIGTMGLIGIAVNDSIVVLSLLAGDARARGADQAAVRELVVDATRHILSTTLTTIGGFLPLILWGGIFWPPLAIAIAGGMVGATLLALFFVPPLFMLCVRSDRRRAERRRMRSNIVPVAVP